MKVDPKAPLLRDKAGPQREAADIMLAAIAGYFERQDLPHPALPAERRHWPVRALLAFALGLAIVAAIAGYVRTLYVVLPDFTGTNETQARRDLRDTGLVVTVRPQSSTIVREHHVIEQDPPAGRWMRRGAAVVLTASTGLPRVAVRVRRFAAKTTIAPARAPRIARSPRASPRRSYARHAVVAAAPARAPTESAITAPAPQPTICRKRSWLQKTVQNVLAPRAPTCRWSPGAD